MIEEDLKAPAVEHIVNLFVLDAIHLGAEEIVRFCSNILGGDDIIFDGNVYKPLPIEAKGFESTTSGEIPRPTIKVGNIGGLVAGLVINHDNLVNAKLTRIRTLSQYLGEGVEPELFQTETFTIQQKTNQNNLFIEFQLSSALDQETEKLPRRVAMAEYCQLCYRFWSGGEFKVVEQNACKYSGDDYFNAKGEAVTDAEEDVCGKKLLDCKKRFKRETLGGTFFPGMRRIK